MTVTHFFSPDRGGWGIVLNCLKARRPLLLLLDYDGTVVPIKRHPGLAVLPPRQRSLLKALSEYPGIRIGFVTGRSLADIWGLVRLNNFIYVANHGLQIRAGRLSWIHPWAKRTTHLISVINQNLQEALTQAEGVEIENKILTLSIHYRNMKGWTVAQLKESADEILRPHARELRVSAGKKVLEVRPNISWDKGMGVIKIVQMLKYRRPPLKMFLGDDVTDEDAFRVLKKDGIGVRVGRSLKTEARYYLRNHQEVIDFLKLIEKALAI